MVIDLYNWNSAFNYVMDIKKQYVEQFGEPKEYNLIQWIEALNNQEFNSLVDNVDMTHFNDMALIRYKIGCENMYTDKDSIYREMRSVVIDLKNEALVLVPFRKFFNLNEVEENNFELVKQEIQNAKQVEFSVKLDGSMQSFRWYNGEIVSAGSQALDLNASWRLQDGNSFLTDAHRNMIMDNSDYTFIFEYISEVNANVVAYPKEMEGIHLIGMRNVFNGVEKSYFDIQNIANQYQIRCTPIEEVALENVMQLISERKSDDFEGWVLNIDSHKIKIKCDDYVQMHKVLSAITSVNVLIRSVADGTFDDLYSKVPLGHKPRVKDIFNKICKYVSSMNHEISEYYKQAPKDDKKEFMIWVDANCPKHLQGYVRNKYLGKPYDVLTNGKGGFRKANEMGINPKLDILSE